jgi:hypothetical protein
MRSCVSCEGVCDVCCPSVMCRCAVELSRLLEN